MYNGKRFTAVVLSAGKGSRMKADIPKQYMKVCGKEVIFYSLKAFQESPVDDIVLVAGKDDIDYCRHEIVDRYHFDKVIDVVEGGSERYLSVRNGLDICTASDYVLIHDSARPCINIEMIERLMKEVIECGACSVGVPAKDTIKVVDDNNYGIDTPDRKTLWQVQTPQAFLYSELIKAYSYLEKDGNVSVTDDTMIVEKYLDRKSKLIMGDYRNIKITTPEDISVVENFLKKS